MKLNLKSACLSAVIAATAFGASLAQADAVADAMADVIRACQTCTLLGIEDTPLAEASNRMPPLTNALMQRYGDEWNYSLTINDLPFDFMASALQSAGKAADGFPRNVSAGDGSQAAFQRIQTKYYQYGTVAEPLRLHGWQAMDEMNRALNGEADSGYVVPVHLFTPDNVTADGGANFAFDPDNGYRDAYQAIWSGK